LERKSGVSTQVAEMAEGSGGNTGLAMIVGGLVVIVALFFVFGGVDIFRGGGDGADLDVQIETPAAPAGG
jgi:hypothetical protein